MEDIDMKQLADAYKRIEESLSSRFEKDVRLYLPMEDVEELKKLIYQGKYEKILEKYRLRPNKYTAEILTNVLIKNAWLMRETTKRKDLLTIFEDCDLYYMTNIMEDGIFDNTIEIPLAFRSELIVLYLQRLDRHTCEMMLKQNLTFLNDSNLRAACVGSALKELPVETRYQSFNEYIRKWPSITKADAIFNMVFPKQEVNDIAMCRRIFEDQIVSPNNRKEQLFWLDMLDVNGKRNMLTLLKTYFRKHPSDKKGAKEIIGCIFNFMKSDWQSLAEIFADACSSLDKEAAEAVAQEVSKRIANENLRKIILEAFRKYGIEFQEREHAYLDIDAIVTNLDKDYVSPKLMGYLIISFDKQYRKTYKESLQKIKDQCCFDDMFNNFACELAIRRFPSFVPYMLYVMEDVAPKADKVIQDVLKKFKDEDILRTGRRNRRIPKEAYDMIADFIKVNDFELFKQLTN